ncbi:rhomboid-like protein [Streptomyces sp. NPDC046197]|uniref:rhomboid-like protein n=1 Tax=Streptomyces sp. NPDC046197 TaxID=3154337 RepID=UPI00340FACC0
MPQQRGRAAAAAPVAPSVVVPAALPVISPVAASAASPVAVPATSSAVSPVAVSGASHVASSAVALVDPAVARPWGGRWAGTSRLPGRLSGLRPRHLLPTPAGTPFTFWYAALLSLTSLVARYADPALMDTLYQSSSTDVAHLVQAPLLVLPASALWIAGGIASPYSLCFLLVLTALERRTGGVRTVGVFLFGHVLATLATEVPVALAVLAGGLPDSSLHRLDYGISFGVACSIGALSGLLTPRLRWPLLAAFVGLVLKDLLVDVTDPLTGWGHLISVGLGVATWPVLRRRCRARVQDGPDPDTYQEPAPA